MAQTYDISFTRGEHFSLDFHLVRGESAYVQEANTYLSSGASGVFGVGAPSGSGTEGAYYFNISTGDAYRYDGSAWQLLNNNDLRLENFANYHPRMQVRSSTSSDKTYLDSEREAFVTKEGDFTVKIFLSDDRSARLPAFSGRYDLWLEDEVDTSKSYLVLNGTFEVLERVTRF